MAEPSLEAASFWANIFVVALTVLAAMAGIFALYFSSRLGTIKDDALERFKADSAAQIASANARAAEAAEGTARALGEAAKANERAGTLELEASQQKERAAKAELELLKLQERLAPRVLSGHQRVALVNALKQAAQKDQVDVACVLGDADGIAFASQLGSALREAGWPGGEVGQAVFAPANPIGSRLVVRSVAKPPPHALALLRALEAAGLNMTVVEDGQLPEGKVQILIGNKPQ